MNWAHVARLDVEHAIRSRLLWGVLAAMILIVPVAVAIPRVVHGLNAFGRGIEIVYMVAGIVAPVVGLVVGYRAVVGERESGSVRFLLGLPNSRRDVVVGKVLGRFAVVTVAAVVAVLAGTVVLLALYEGFDVVDYLAVSGNLLLSALFYVAVAVAVSASVGSSTRAAAGAFGAYLLLVVVWSFVPWVAYWLLHGSFPEGSTPTWMVVLEYSQPMRALEELLLVSAGTFDDATWINTVGPAADAVEGGLPAFFDAYLVGVVIAWLVGPLAVGYLLFERADLS